MNDEKLGGRTAGSRNGGEELAEAMRAAGFVRVEEAAALLKLAPGTVRLWAKREKVAKRVVSHALFVSRDDCVREFGVENALLLNIVSETEAANIRRGKAKS